MHAGVLCTIGRVQTPALSSRSARREIADFRLFYELVARAAEDSRETCEQPDARRAKEEAERLPAAQSTEGTVVIVKKD